MKYFQILAKVKFERFSNFFPPSCCCIRYWPLNSLYLLLRRIPPPNNPHLHNIYDFFIRHSQQLGTRKIPVWGFFYSWKTFICYKGKLHLNNSLLYFPSSFCWAQSSQNDIKPQIDIYPWRRHNIWFMWWLKVIPNRSFNPNKHDGGESGEIMLHCRKGWI